MLRKFASFEVLEATLAPVNDPLGLQRYAHRHNFTYEPRPGYLYVRSRAISSRCNDNYDEFPASEIKEAYRSFVGKPVFVNHNNDNHRRARGVIIDAALHEDKNPDGTPDTWAEVLMEVDAVRFPRLAKAILAGHIDRTSMGTDVAFSVCSVCNNKATTPLEYCAHIPKMKGQRIYRTTASGRREGILVREICHGLKFFENSLLVEEPADPTAFFLGVDDHSGLASTASKTASESHEWQDDFDGRYCPKCDALMSQGDDARANMPCPGKPDHDEMKPPKFKPGDRVIDHHGEGATIHSVHPSDTPGKSHRVMVRWDDPEANLTWDGKEPPKGEVGDKRAFYEHVFEPHPDAQGSFEDHVNSAIPHDHLDRQMLEQQGRGPSRLSSLASLNPYVAHGDHTDLQSDDEGPHSHSKIKLSPETVEVMQSASDAGRMHGEMHDHNERRTVNLSDPDDLMAHMLHHGYETTDGHLWRNSEDEDHPALDEADDLDRPLHHHEIRRLHDWEHGHGITNDHPDYNGGEPGHFMDDSHFHTASKLAYGETMAPADVDTLRDEECPVCGEADAYDGNECQVCGFVAPPKMFQDPDLDTAKSMDLRKDIAEGQETDPNEDGMPDVIPGSGQPGTDEIPMNANEVADPDDAGQEQVDKITDEQQPLQPGDIADDGQVVDDQQTDDDGNMPDLMCPNCGFETQASPPQSTPTDADAPVADGAVEGDVCPNCAEGLLTTAQDAAQQEPQQGEAVPVGRAASAVKGWNDSRVNRREGSTQKEQSMRPALAAVAAQQRTIDAQAARIATLEAQVEFIARLAGVTQHVAALKVEADINNPAQPIPDPPSEAAFETTEQAATPSAMDSPLNPGMTPGSVNNLAADTTTTPLVPGEALPTAPFNVLENVQAPVAGTETQRPLDETKIETDVRVGDPMNPQVAFPWTLSSLSGEERAERTMASLRLARLRRQAGLSNEDELGLAEKIASDETMIPAVIENEIATLSVVTKNAAQQQARPAGRPGGLVPRAASQGVQRTVPSLSAEAGLAAQAGGGSVADDTTDSDLFD
jgi:hypothetical protein